MGSVLLTVIGLMVKLHCVKMGPLHLGHHHQCCCFPLSWESGVGSLRYEKPHQKHRSHCRPCACWCISIQSTHPPLSFSPSWGMPLLLFGVKLCRGPFSRTRFPDRHSSQQHPSSDLPFVSTLDAHILPMIYPMVIKQMRE